MNRWAMTGVSAWGGCHSSVRGLAIAARRPDPAYYVQHCPSGISPAEEFLGGTLTTCRGAGGCVSVFQGSSLTLGQMAGACIYVDGAPTVIPPTKWGIPRVAFVRCAHLHPAK